MVKYIMKSLQCTEEVTSPTYALVNEYEIPKGKVYHMDLYRIKDEDELLNMGIEEYWESADYNFIEWPDIAQDFFAEGQYATQTETLERHKGGNKLSIGIPKEIYEDENRIALTPNSIRAIIGHGHKVIVESGAGEKSHYTDYNYSEAGAQVTESRKEVYSCDVIVKIAPPTMEELSFFKPNQVLLSSLLLPRMNEPYMRALKSRKIIAIAMEYLPGEDGTYPVVRIMSEIAGMSAIYTAGELLSAGDGGRGVLLGGISGVPPAKIVILGAGVVGEFATKTALAMGASVRIFDNDVSKLMRLQSIVGRHLHTSTFNPVYLAYQLLSADVLIAAVHSKSGRVPILVTEEMVSKMKPGSVIMDISMDQGGCVETSEITSHRNPTFIKHDVIHYGVPNIPSKVPRTASAAISNILTPMVLRMADQGSIESLLYDNKNIRLGVYSYKGCITNKYLANRFGLGYQDINLLLASKM
ncbi:unnamed protein product, partial [Cyprideis torosa]